MGVYIDHRYDMMMAQFVFLPLACGFQETCWKWMLKTVNVVKKVDNNNFGFSALL